MTGPRRSPTNSSRHGPAPGRRAPLQVLLVEDDAAFSAYVRLALGAGADAVEVRTASDLSGALEALRDGHPDGILLDLNLPDSQGLASVRPVLDAAPRTAVVILTGVAETSVAQEATHCVEGHRVSRSRRCRERQVGKHREARSFSLRAAMP